MQMSGDMIEDLERLARLRNEQIVSQEEFQKLKEKIINKHTAPKAQSRRPRRVAKRAAKKDRAKAYGYQSVSRNPDLSTPSNPGPRARRQMDLEEQNRNPARVRPMHSGGQGAFGGPLPQIQAQSGNLMRSKNRAAAKAMRSGGRASRAPRPDYSATLIFDEDDLEEKGYSPDRVAVARSPTRSQGRSVYGVQSAYARGKRQPVGVPSSNRPSTRRGMKSNKKYGMSFNIKPKPRLGVADLGNKKKHDPKDVYLRIDDSQLEKFRQAFAIVDDDRDGIIHNDDFIRVLRNLGENPSELECEYYLDMADRGMDGVNLPHQMTTINFLEFCDLMCKIWDEQQTDWFVPWPRDDVFSAFNTLDETGVGAIEPDGFIDLLTSCGEPLGVDEARELVDVAPKDRNGWIVCDELAKFLTEN